jgi:hypothetical protein
LFKVCLPSHRIGKLFVGVFREPGNSRPGECMFAHIGQGGIVDHVIGVPGAQQVEEVQSALASRRAEPVVVANLRADAVGAFVAGTSVVHCDPTGRLQTRAQHITCFGQECILVGDQHTHDLPLGDVHTNRPKHRHQPRHGHLSLVVLHRHEAAQFRPGRATDRQLQGPVRQARTPATAGHLPERLSWMVFETR